MQGQGLGGGGGTALSLLEHWHVVYGGMCTWESLLQAGLWDAVLMVQR